MKILVIGSGGREHALAWKISLSKKPKKIFCAPGNGGTGTIAENVDIRADDIEKLLRFAKDNKIDLTVVGPEVPLVKGIVDIFSKEGLKIFGPCKPLALLEGSKAFAKSAMRDFGVATADFKVFDNVEKAKAYLKEKGAPIVVKADGLCAGKGVVVAKSVIEAENAIDAIMVKKIFGSAGDKIVLEECLEGEEASILVFTDGKTIIPLESSQDHKRIFDNDKGANTGGMGAYSPAPVISKKVLDEVVRSVFKPVIDGFRENGDVYKGVLYGGLMITGNGIRVLEFNVRFGDPETQAILPRLDTDLVDIMLACIDGTLDKSDVKWNEKACLCVVCAAKGYPEEYEKHIEVKGLEKLSNQKDVYLFHAGTVCENGKIFTNGGRVLGVTALEKDIRSAKLKAYDALSNISFNGMQYRKDIGDRAIR